MSALAGKKGVIFGIANRDSIAYGCARAMREQGAGIAATFLNAKAEPYVRPLAEELGCEIVLPCDVERPGEMEAVFEAIGQRWGRLDFAVHAVAYAPKGCLTERILGTPLDVGSLSAFLASDAAASMTGNVIHVDAGYHVLG